MPRHEILYIIMRYRITGEPYLRDLAIDAMAEHVRKGRPLDPEWVKMLKRGVQKHNKSGRKK